MKRRCWKSRRPAAPYSKTGFLRRAPDSSGTAVPTAAFLVLAIVFGYLITTRNDGLFLVLTAVCGVLFAACFVAFGISTNRFVNARRINRINEDLSSTEEGERLLKLRAYKELYEHFVG